MKSKKISLKSIGLAAGLASALLLPGAAWGCACGCGVFDVGTSSMFPSGPGGMFFATYAFQDQNRNWSGFSRAPAENNEDKEIETQFTSIGLQYMFNSSWGFEAELPYDFRTFKTVDEDGNPISRHWNQIGDARIRGIYTGFSPDLSGGLTLGLKLPTGSFRFDPEVVDRDTQLGTGSTDALVGGFYRHNITENGEWDWFAQAELDVPFLIQDQYRPGLELDTAAGIYYQGFSLGSVRISPIAQVIFSERTSDSGANSAQPVASGFQRLLLSAGIECDVHPVKLYADVEVPVFQRFTGDQLAAPALFKFSVSWMF